MTVDLKYNTLRPLDTVIWKNRKYLEQTLFQRVFNYEIEEAPFTHGICYIGNPAQGVFAWFNPVVPYATVSSFPAETESSVELLVIRPRAAVSSTVTEPDLFTAALDQATDGILVTEQGAVADRIQSIMRLWSVAFQGFENVQFSSFEELIKIPQVEIISTQAGE